ncbi:hypothetical protein [Burkholderia territorii]|uniref:hypothetical protein n=1 Tax=Burkholderia territorii TaxID=1503055 RepID=UPI000A7F78EF|nr:hypothetical protein [Burkholderia territorii]
MLDPRATCWRAVPSNTGKFKEFAFKTHAMAYLDGGLADLPIMDLVRIGARPNIREWGDGRTWGQAVDSAIAVLRNKAEAWDIDDPLGKPLGRLLVKCHATGKTMPLGRGMRSCSADRYLPIHGSDFRMGNGIDRPHAQRQGIRPCHGANLMSRHWTPAVR